MEAILEDILGCLYSYTMQAVIFTMLLSLTVLFLEQNGFKNGLHIWLEKWKASFVFRRQLLFYFYSYILAVRTLFNRTIIWDSLSDVMGGWWIERNANGVLILEAPENILLFIPLMFLFFLAFPKAVKKNRFGTYIWKSICISFLVSLVIETNQLVFRIGTFQIADLVYNTGGGVIGCFLYLFARKLKRNDKKRKQ